MIGAPNSTVITVPAARNGPKGICVRRCTLSHRQQQGGRHARHDEAEQEADDHLAVADPAEKPSAQARKPHVAEADPLRHGDRRARRRRRRPLRHRSRRSASADQRCVPAEARTSSGAPSAAVAYTIGGGNPHVLDVDRRDRDQAEPPARSTRAAAQSEANRQASSTNRTPVPSSKSASRGGMCAPQARHRPRKQYIGDDRDVVVGPNGRRASDTVRRRRHDRLLAGEPVDDHADERADDQADDAGDRL